MIRPGLGDEERTREVSPFEEIHEVTHRHRLGDGVDPEGRPGEIAEAERWLDAHLHPRISEEEFDRVLGDHGGTRNGVDHGACTCPSDHIFDDCSVERFEVVGVLVERVVGRQIRERRCSGVDVGPQDGRARLEQIDGLGREVLRSCRSETDDGDGADVAHAGTVGGVTLSWDWVFVQVP